MSEKGNTFRVKELDLSYCGLGSDTARALSIFISAQGLAARSIVQTTQSISKSNRTKLPVISHQVTIPKVDFSAIHVKNSRALELKDTSVGRSMSKLILL